MMIYPMGFIGSLVHMVTGIPYFAWIRGGDYYFMKDNRLKRWMIDQVFRDTLVFVQTEAVREDVLREFPHATLRVLGNGVEMPDNTANGDSIVFVGRLKRQKGVHILLEAMKNVDQHLIIVGDGPERNQLETTATRTDLDVEFVGEVAPDAVHEYLLEGSVFVLPSVAGEGLPNALLEAMSVGLPVIGTDTGGMKNAIVDGETGYVVPPGDLDALAERLDTLVTDDSRQNRLGRAAREYVVAHHSWERITDELDSLYAELVSENSFE
jgi:glycosyltransferase involved in cell wall biosynthesis